MSRSRYDDIHDEYFSADIKKAGTRYERLVAAVQKILEGNKSTVVHDIRLRGESDVAHQIDVTVERGNTKKRILIECKDFNISGEKVGLGIVRDFWGVIDDVHPDVALILSTEGFTEPAQKYAKAKGIGLRVLREYTAADDLERINKIHLTFEWSKAEDFRMNLIIPDPANEAQLKSDMQNAGMSTLGASRTDPIMISHQGTKKQLLEFIEGVLFPAIARATGDAVRLPLNMPGATLTVASGTPIPIAGMVLQCKIQTSEDKFEIAAQGTVKMILEAIDGDETLIYDHELSDLKIDESGTVSQKGDDG